MTTFRFPMILLLLAGAATAEEAWRCDWLGASEGTLQASAVDQSAGLVQSGGWLLRLDLSDPLQPQVVGRSWLPVVIQDLALEDGLALAATSDEGLLVLDAAQGVPGVLSSYGVDPPVEGAPFHTVDLQGDLAALGGSGGVIQLLDLSDPQDPRLLDHWTAQATVGDLLLHGSWLLASLGADGLAVYDISTPQEVTQAAMLAEAVGASRLAMDGVRLLATRGAEDIWIIDLADPLQPQLLGEWNGPGNTECAVLFGNTAYLARGFGGLAVLDLEDAGNPQLVETISLGGATCRTQLGPGLVWMTDSHRGLQAFSLEQPQDPQPLGAYRAEGSAYRLGRFGSLLGVARQAAGFSLQGELDGEQLPLVARLDLEDPDCRSLVLHEQKAYLADWSEGLYTADLENPQQPLLLDGPLSDPVADLAREGELLAGVAQGQLQLWGLPESGLPQELGSLPVSSGSRKLRLREGLAYIACDGEGLQIVDCTDPAQPELVGDLQLGTFGEDVALLGDLAYLGCHVVGVRIVDISDPAAPQVVGQFDTPGQTQGLAVYADHLFIADGSSGLRVYDLEDPLHPQLVGWFDNGGYALDVLPGEETIYLATGSLGVQALAFEDFVSQKAPALPAAFELLPNHPNPFNPSTVIPFRLERPAEIRLAVYNLQGALVRELARGVYGTGEHQVAFDGTGLASGVYIGRLAVPGESKSQAMLLLK